MVYANDQWVLLPVRDLYDSQIMAMAISAAKDMYDKGLQEMKEFNKEYGDFVTPIVGDLEKYDRAVTGRIRNVVNSIYAAGGDPLRDPQARMIISRELANMPTKDIATWRQRAENAKEWYKNMGVLRSKGLYNEDFSNFLRENPQMWGENDMGFTSPTAYDDLNSHTSHWFDKVNRDAYLRTEDGFDYFGVRPEDLTAVMDQNMPDFLNSDYGRYLMELAKRQLGPNASAEDVVNKLRLNVVSANKEMTISPTRRMSKERELELEDFYNAKQAARSFEYNKRLAELRGSGSGRKVDKTDNGEHDSAEGLFYRGLIHAGGTESIADTDLDQAIEQARDNIIDSQLYNYRYANLLYGSNDKDKMRYLISASSIQEPVENFSRYIARPTIDKATGSVLTIASDNKNLYSEEYLSTNLYGLRAKNNVTFDSGGSGIKRGQVITPTTNVPTLFFKDTDGLYKVGQFWEVYVSDVADDGTADESTARKRYMKLPTTRAATTNMPKPTRREYINKDGKLDAKYRPNITPNYSTKGLKNQGSRDVNKTEGASAKSTYSGTLNPEAVRK